MADGFNFQPYIQPYVAPPIQEFNTMGEVLNERYEQNIANMTELELLTSQIQVLPTSQAIKDQMLGDVNRALTEIREKGDVENAAPRVREAVRRFATDPNLRQAAENFQKAQQYDEEIRQIRLQTGQDPLVFQDYRNEQYIDGRLQPILSDNQKRLDYSARYRTFFDQLQPSSVSEQDSGYKQRPDGVWEQVGSATQEAGIAIEQIQSIAKERLGEYLNTAEGIQELRALTSDRYGGLSREEAIETIRQNLIGAGMARVFTQTATSTSASPIADPYLARQSQLLDIQNKKLQIAQNAMKGNTAPTGTSYIIKGNDLSDASIGSNVPKKEWLTNKGINSLLDYAFSGEPEDRIRGKFEFQNILDNLESSNSEEVRETASRYRHLISRAEELLGDNADEFIHSTLRGRPSGSLSALSGLPPELKTELTNEAIALRRQSKGLISDTKFENEIEAALKSPITRNIAWLGPKYIGNEAFDSSLRTAWNAATSSEEWDLSNFDIVRGDSKAASELKDTRVEVINVSNDVIGGGHGIGYLIRDSEGGVHVAVPKTTGYEHHLEAQFLPQVAQVLGANDLVYKNQFKHNVIPGQSKSLEEIAKQNNIEVFGDISNMKIRGVDGGFELYDNNNPYTFKDYYKDFASSTMSERATNKIVNDARRAGVITTEDIREVMTSNGDVDIRLLLPKIQNSSKPVLFESQYDIYNAYLK